MYAWAILFLICLGIAWSIKLRVSRFRQVADNIKIKPSPLSLAIHELIAVAGGLYLSLIMLVSFLKIDIPGKIFVYRVEIDPLACTAIVLALFQPLLAKLFKDGD
ncbi:hypothetical protein SDC9_06174 [bioreactor metagenome]|uniref:Uncharacterized protein n=1 Tax=bioreactor metagenome TaxID=1076179 RepID=A0A644T126_9ZZZZ|nr:hypothetical protein [Negativicutes bacterium]